MRLPPAFHTLKHLFACCLLLTGLALPLHVWAVNAPGSLDTGFNPDTNKYVAFVAVQVDGKVLIGGWFTMVNGVARNRIARLNSDGSLDTGFNPGTGADGTVYSVAVQTDGKVLIGGSFTTVNGVARNYIARLNSDGSLDAGFNPGTGASSTVDSVAVQTDGKVLIGGSFTTVNGVARNCIARLNSDGSLDSGLNPSTEVSGVVLSVALQADGKMLIGGGFSTVNGVARSRIARLNADGSLDTSFDPGTGANNTVYSVVLQADGKVLIDGYFTTLNGVARNRIARLHSDGSLDTGFNPGIGADSTVRSVALQADGKLLIGGDFTTVDGVARNRIARLHSDGSLDAGFNPGTGANVFVYSVALQADGKVLVGGDFNDYNGTGINRMARIHSGDADQDGIEDAADYFSNNAAAAMDTDRDGLPVAWLQPNAFGCVANASSCNGLMLDIDNDNDGVPDTSDNCLLNANTDQLDTDGDAQGNVCDTDDDNDGVPDFTDGFPLNAAASSDVDADGFPGSWHAACDAVCQGNAGLVLDNCPLIANVDQADEDHDGVGNACESDGPGKLDTGFNPGTGANSDVSSVALQADGKVLIGGWFSTVNDVARNKIARLNSDGSLDTGFDPGTGANNTVYSVAVQADGKVLIGGYFTTVNGVARNRIARLNSDGSLDAGFNLGTGANNDVSSVAAQADGKVLIGGYFTTVNGVVRNRIARLNGDGSLDTGFNPGTGANSAVESVALQADGKVLVGGWFTTVNGVVRNRIARLHSDGSLDAGFNSGTGVNQFVYSVALQADGKVLIGGAFTTLNGVKRNYIARMNSDGSLDTSFNSSLLNDYVRSVAAQADGKVLIGGQFTMVNDVARNYIARLNGDGSLDTGFNPGTGANSVVISVALQADGRALVGGSFTSYNGTNINRIVRIHTGDADQDGIENAADLFPDDTDNDGIGNNTDLDDDGDSVPDYIDAAPLNASNTSEIILPVNSSYDGGSISEAQNLQ